MKFSIKDFFSKCEQIRRKLVPQEICSHLLNKSLMENFIFYAVTSDDMGRGSASKCSLIPLPITHDVMLQPLLHVA